ncbi:MULTISPECIES: hypothetical protein [Flavobacterium]|uniref:Uncharacterized protein n=2 Tax=Flavobacterium TaxID=237 RepID=A0A6V6Z7L0_9FLAO|nr:MULTISPECIES: hypothetical protein [Flavobacterium]OOV17428.1 hypothetical protein BXU10_15125 [Flavobacterium sp. LM4]CAD0006924.1 hypothetical protein FLAT13_03582 [Flavobacterium salmonis]CAD0007599.1 hypothetical protein FLACHUCJ7_03398 [Flavobacterium chungangense]
METETQIFWLFILAIPIACISWTVTQEEIFREPREWCVNCSKNNKKILIRKFFYLFTCEYCFSHYITIFFICICNFKLLIDDARGYLIAGFSLVFVANIYMSLFALLRQTIKKEKVEIKKIENSDEL